MTMDDGIIMPETAAERLRLWSEALGYLAQEEIALQLVSALQAGNREHFEALLGPTRIFQIGGCIDIVETITRVVNFGRWHFEERCDVVPTFYPPAPSDVNGTLYQLPDGRVVFVSQKLWFDYHKRAAEDPAWRAANQAFLQALGIIQCRTVIVSDSELVSIERARTICFPTVVDPYER